MKRILYIQYTNPGGYPPLQHSSRILSEDGWSVLFLGTGSAGANDLRFPTTRNLTVRRMPFCTAGWQQKLHYVTFCLWTLVTALIWRPQWIYASDPLSCPVTCILNWLPGLRVLYHEHDSPPLNTRHSRFLAFVLRTRHWAAHHVDLCVLPNMKRLERFQAELGPLRCAACVWNCPAVSEAALEPRQPASIPIWALYHGSIVPDRLPLAVVDALALLGNTVSLRVVGYETVGSRGHVDALRRRAEELGILNRLEFLGALPQRTDLLLATARSDIGLALMPSASTDPNCQTMTGASNKAFDYLTCGLPVVVSDLPDWRQMFVDSGYGIACDPGDPRSIAAAIGWLVNHPDRMREMGESGRQRVLSEWNYENMFKPVLQQLSQPRTRTLAPIQADESAATRRLT